MRFLLRLLDREVFEICTGDDAKSEPEKPDEKDNPGGQFGFGRTDMTAIEHGTQRWETSPVFDP